MYLPQSFTYIPLSYIVVPNKELVNIQNFPFSHPINNTLNTNHNIQDLSATPLDLEPFAIPY